MRSVCDFDRLVRKTVILLLLVGRASTSTITPSPSQTVLPTPVQSNGTCEFRTINYITDTLPQQCLKSAWSASNATGARVGEAASATIEHVGSTGNITATATDISTDPTNIQAETVSADLVEIDLESGELDEPFLSFEEWKKQTLDKEKESVGSKKSGDGFQNHLDSVGDDSELDVDFSSFKAGTGSGDSTQRVEKETRDDRELEEKPKKRDHYRSKDAGKTCKERFSYASFDAGATVLKTHKGAKNAKSVLIENKDSYMLSQCSEENKFIIIELSEDIWIDTLVLANYEFFSSMIRTFRVSVSDRYPVPVSKWKDIGTYEARNSRDIQAFLIENPQIWARYIRIEFLSHFGNEYYCPLSLVRVHGTRMLESWKMEGSVEEEEEVEEIDESTEEEGYVPEAVAEVVKEEEERLKAAAEEMEKATELMAAEVAAAMNYTTKGSFNINAIVGAPTNPWDKPGFYVFELDDITEQEDVCMRSETPAEEPVSEINYTATVDSTVEGISTSSSKIEDAKFSVPATSSSQAAKETSKPSSPVSAPTATNTTSIVESSSQIPSSQYHTKANVTATSAHKNKTATTTSSSSSSLPTIQESFFKAVSRRLSLLESNSTLSLAYISEQSKFLREAFTKVEKKQLQKTTQFLDNLNNTVLAELRGFRQQYDEIWQSTVISLESQREESRRELLAVTERLGILGEEVVWQRRMSIVQSVLLLLCLGLVIFSRVSSSENLPFHIPRSRTFASIESPTEGEWLRHHRQTSEDEQTSPSRDLSRSPPTPYERELTPPSEEIDDLMHKSLPSTPHFEIQDDDLTQQTLSPSPMVDIATPPLRRTKSTSGHSYKSTKSASPAPSPANSIKVKSSPRREGGDQPQQSTPKNKESDNPITRHPILSSPSLEVPSPLLSRTKPTNGKTPANSLSPANSIKIKSSSQKESVTTSQESSVKIIHSPGNQNKKQPMSLKRQTMPSSPNLEIPDPLAHHAKSVNGDPYTSPSPVPSPASSIIITPSLQKENSTPSRADSFLVTQPLQREEDGDPSPLFTPTKKKRKSSAVRKRAMSHTSMPHTMSTGSVPPPHPRKRASSHSPAPPVTAIASPSPRSSSFPIAPTTQSPLHAVPSYSPSAVVSQNPFNVLCTYPPPGLGVKNKKSKPQLQTPEPTPNPGDIPSFEDTAGGSVLVDGARNRAGNESRAADENGKEDANSGGLSPNSDKKFSIARKPLPALPTGLYVVNP